LSKPPWLKTINSHAFDTIAKPENRRYVDGEKEGKDEEEVSVDLSVRKAGTTITSKILPASDCMQPSQPLIVGAAEVWAVFLLMWDFSNEGRVAY
jgi:hypothetical protein